MTHSKYDILDNHCNSVDDEEKNDCEIITNKNDTELSLLIESMSADGLMRRAVLQTAPREIETYIDWLRLRAMLLTAMSNES